MFVYRKTVVEIYGDLNKIKYDGIVSASGSTVVINDRIVDDNIFNQHDLEELTSYFSNKQIPYIVENSKGLFGTKEAKFVLENRLEKYCAGMSKAEKENNGFTQVVNQVTIVDSMKSIGFNKVCFFESPVNFNELVEQFSKRFEVIPATYAPYGERSGEITRKDITKATGMQRIQEHYGCDSKDIISIGDGYNDLCMFKASNISIAMGNAPEDIKKETNYVTDTLENDGIYKAFQMLQLI